MKKGLEGFSFQSLSEMKGYSESVDEFFEIEEKKIWENISKRFMTPIQHVFWFLVISISGTLITGTYTFFILYGILWLLTIATYKRRKNSTLNKELNKNKELTEADKIRILEICLDDKNLQKLGKAFYMIHNEVTNNSKRNYLGNVFISLDKGHIYISEGKNLLQRDFNISDIVSFRRVSEDGLGEVSAQKNFTKDVEKIISAENEANHKIAKSEMGSAVGKPSAFNQIDAYNATLRANKAKEALDKKIKTEEKRIKDETYIKLLKFSNDDHLFISHLEDSVVIEIENKIENS